MPPAARASFRTWASCWQLSPLIALPRWSPARSRFPLPPPFLFLRPPLVDGACRIHRAASRALRGARRSSRAAGERGAGAAGSLGPPADILAFDIHCRPISSSAA